MLAEVFVTDAVDGETGVVLHAGLIGLRVLTVEREVEVEVRIFLLQFPEVLEEERLAERACPVEEVHLTVAHVQRLGHVHDLRPQRSHAGAAADPYHLLAGSEVGMEVAVRAAHHHLVARFEREDVRRPDACRHVLEAHLRARQERCRGDADGQHDDVALGRIVRHGIGTDGRFGVVRLEREDVELLPRSEVLLADVVLVEVLVVVDAVVGRNLDLRIGPGEEVHVLARRQCHLELLDEAGHVLVGDDGTLPLLDAHDRLRHLQRHVALHLALASKPPVVLDFLAAEVRAFGVEYLAAAFHHLHLALSAAGLAAAGRRQEDSVLVQRRHDGTALVDGQLPVAVDGYRHLSARAEVLLRHEQEDYQHEDGNQEYRNTCCYELSHDCSLRF